MFDAKSSVPERQATLRALYARSPEAARIVKRVRSVAVAGTDPSRTTTLAENLVHPDKPYGVTWELGLDEAVGGLHDAPNPGEMLCGCLAACQFGVLRMMAATLKVELEELEVEVTGYVDVRGTLNIDPQVRVGFESLHMDVRLRAAPDTPPRLLERLRLGGERLCVTLDTLRRGVPVEASYDMAATAAVT